MLSVNQLAGFGVGGGAGFPPFQGVDVTTGLGGSVTSSGDFSGSYVAANLIDNSAIGEVGTSWIEPGSPGWWRIDLGSPTHIYQYTVQWWNNTSVAARAWRSWTFQGSDNGSSWTTIESQSVGAWSSSQKRTFILNEPVEYRYYRFENIANLSGGLMQMGEIELLQ